MSICSDIYITKEKAKTQVKNILMLEQANLVNLAVNSMTCDELSIFLNRDSDLYYYNIEEDNE